MKAAEAPINNPNPPLSPCILLQAVSTGHGSPLFVVCAHHKLNCRWTCWMSSLCCLFSSGVTSSRAIACRALPIAMAVPLAIHVSLCVRLLAVLASAIRHCWMRLRSEAASMRRLSTAREPAKRQAATSSAVSLPAAAAFANASRIWPMILSASTATTTVLGPNSA